MSNLCSRFPWPLEIEFYSFVVCYRGVYTVHGFAESQTGLSDFLFHIHKATLNLLVNLY